MENARILIVEDEAVVAENLEMMITDAGYEVVGRAASADDAVNAAIELKPDLILMDIVLLGQKNGIDASHEIKEKMDIPITFLTACSDFELIDRAKDTEPYAYIVKPFQEGQLLASIEMALYKSQMARKLKESEERYRILVEHSPLGTFKADTMGNIEIANPALLRMLGSPSEEATIQVNLLTDPLLMEAGVSKLVKECMEKGESLNSEFLYRSKWEKEVYCNIFLTPVYNTGGQLSGIQGSLEDITARKAAEEALRESEERYRRMVANVPGMVYQFVLHPDGSMAFPFVSESCRELFGMEYKELRRDANALLDIIHPDDRSGFYRSVADSAESLSPWEWEGRGIVSGDERWFRCISRPEQQANGDILWDGVVIEITERKVAEQRIEEEYRRAEFYIDLMGHDINNMNQVTRGHLDLLLRMPDFPDKFRNSAKIALNHVRKSTDIISNVRTLSEVQSDEIELARIDIYPAYASAVEVVKSLPRDVRINSNITEGTCFIRGNAFFFNVFSTLLNNAVKFDCHEVVEIDVDISPSADNWRLEFKDRGHGISDEYKKIIFNRLERAGESAQGTGLGLTIVKYVVASYGGSIWVEDRVSGDRTQGSNFILLLPKEK